MIEESYLKKFPRELPVPLNEAENQAYGKLLADKVKEESLLEDAKKQEVARRNVEIKKVSNEIARVAEARSKGAELRSVLCGERLHGSVVELVRLDTMSVVESRPATMQEMQVTMGGAFDRAPDLDGTEGDAQPDNVVQFTGADTTSSSGDSVHVGDPNDRDPEVEAEFGSGEQPDEGDDALPSDEEDEDNATDIVIPEGEEGDWIDQKLEERRGSDGTAAKTVAPKTATRSKRERSKKANAKKPAPAKKQSRKR